MQVIVRTQAELRRVFIIDAETRCELGTAFYNAQDDTLSNLDLATGVNAVDLLDKDVDLLSCATGGTLNRVRVTKMTVVLEVRSLFGFVI